MLEMIRRIFKIAGRSRKKIIVGITFNILKSFFNGFMMFGVFWILLHLENLTPAIILWRCIRKCSRTLFLPMDV